MFSWLVEKFFGSERDPGSSSFRQCNFPSCQEPARHELVTGNVSKGYCDIHYTDWDCSCEHKVRYAQLYIADYIISTVELKDMINKYDPKLSKEIPLLGATGWFYNLSENDNEFNVKNADVRTKVNGLLLQLVRGNYLPAGVYLITDHDSISGQDSDNDEES